MKVNIITTLKIRNFTFSDFPLVLWSMCLAVAYSQTTIFWMPLKIQYDLSPDLKWALFAVFSWSMITLIASPLILATDALIEGFVLAPTNIFTIWKNEIANLRNCENINQVSLIF